MFSVVSHGVGKMMMKAWNRDMRTKNMGKIKTKECDGVWGFAKVVRVFCLDANWDRVELLFLLVALRSFRSTNDFPARNNMAVSALCRSLVEAPSICKRFILHPSTGFRVDAMWL